MRIEILSPDGSTVIDTILGDPAWAEEHYPGVWREAADQGDAVDLGAIKASKNEEINAARLAANFSSFPFAGKQIASDQLSRSDIDGTNGYVSLYGAMPPGWPGVWKATDNSYVPLPDVAAWKDLYSAMFAQGNANFAHSQVLKALLAAADTPEDVAAIHWGMEV